MPLARAASWLRLLLPALLAAPALGAPEAAQPPPEIGAESYVLMEALTGEVIAASNPDEPRPPASLTKLMTAYLAFEAVVEGAVALDELIPVSKEARAASGSRMFLEAGSEVSFRALLLGLIVQSGNDAAVAIAEHLAGSEDDFAVLMNEKAAELGMDRSNFGTATGLPAKGQLASARDLATLSRRLALDFPELYQLHAVREFEHNGILQQNRNRLLDEYDGADGLKTGFTRSAGYCLAASAVRHGMRLVGVVMKSSSPSRRAREMEELFNFGFNNFRAVQLFEPGQTLDAVKVWGGADDRVEVGYGLEEPLALLLTRTQANGLRAVLRSDGAPIEAPVSQGQMLAMIEVKSGDEVLAEVPAVALSDVEAGDLWVRAVDYVRLHWLVPGQPEGNEQ